MEKYKLGNIATVEISGVDKKMKDGEKEIHLCNFVDVYYNWAITTAQYDSFMLATARPNEISKFQLKKGQVALLKTVKLVTTLAFQLILAMILMMSYWVIIVL